MRGTLDRWLTEARRHAPRPLCFNTRDPMGVVGWPFEGWHLDRARLQRLLPRRVTRRHVIGGAIAAGSAVTALRLLGQARASSVTANKAAPKAAAATAAKGADWTSPLTAETARITHLLRRATFGASPDELEAAFQLGYGKMVDKLVETAPAAPPAVPGMKGGGGVDVDVLQQWWIDHM